MSIQLVLGVLTQAAICMIIIQKNENKGCYLRQRCMCLCIPAVLLPFQRLMKQNFNLDLPCQTPGLNYPMHYWFCLPKTKRIVSGINVFLFYYSTITPLKIILHVNNCFSKMPRSNWILFLFSKELVTWCPKQRQLWTQEFQYKPF